MSTLQLPAENLSSFFKRSEKEDHCQKQLFAITALNLFHEISMRGHIETELSLTTYGPVSQ
jgi:hypothetical protein